MLRSPQKNTPHGALVVPVLSLPALMALLLSAPAQAGISDTIQPYVSAGYSYDDNLFRLPADYPGGPVSDRSKSTMVGFSFERPVGRQDFSGAAKVTHVTFDRFSQLNYDGKDANAMWRWAAGNDVDGTLGGNYSQVLNSFSDFHSTERNLRIQHGAYLGGGWRFLARWRLYGKVSRDEYRYDLVSQQFLNRNVDAHELSLDYEASTRSTIGLLARRLKGNYTNPLRQGAFLFDPDYTQDELKLKLSWQYDAMTQLQFLGGRVRHTHTFLTGNDSRGTNAQFTGNWQALPQLKLSATLSREFAPYEGSNFSYSLNQTRSLDALWMLANKVQLEATASSTRRDFTGQLLGTPLDETDHQRLSTLALTYVPRNNIQLSASVYRDRRDGAPLISNSYHAKGAQLNAIVQF